MVVASERVAGDVATTSVAEDLERLPGVERIVGREDEDAEAAGLKMRGVETSLGIAGHVGHLPVPALVEPGPEPSGRLRRKRRGRDSERGESLLARQGLEPSADVRGRKGKGGGRGGFPERGSPHSRQRGEGVPSSPSCAA